jgi:hypothetical protein
MMGQRLRTFLITIGVVGGLLLAALIGLRLLARAQGPLGWGPTRGQFVDAETGAPIPGVAVLAFWWKAVLSPIGHPTRTFYDAKEAVSDVQGRFEVAGIWVPIWTLGVQPSQLHFFAPGYAFDSQVVTPPDGVPYEAPTVVKMRRLKTRDELLRKSRSRPGGVPLEKMIEFTKAINVEREMLRLGPLSIEMAPEKRP